MKTTVRCLLLVICACAASFGAEIGYARRIFECGRNVLEVELPFSGSADAEARVGPGSVGAARGIVAFTPGIRWRPFFDAPVSPWPASGLPGLTR